MELKDIIEEIFEEICKEMFQDGCEGKVADYIPQLKNVNPNLFGLSFCDIHGNIHKFGDWENEFSIQSCSKPLNYCLSRKIEQKREMNGLVHKYVGYEPSGRSFNEFVLNKDGKPHNPLINSGAIMVSYFLHPDDEPSTRFDHVKRFYESMSGRIGKVGFDNSIFLSEKRHADRNISLAYYMRENDAYPKKITPSELNDILDLYFQCCSITIDCEIGSVIAGTLANAGKCPISGENVISPEIIKDCLCLMFGCGMYDFSGQFGFKIGLPAKSGVSGCLMLVIPGVGGICIRSPKLDSMGNSVKGVQFCEKFASRTNNKYHIFNTQLLQKETTVVPTVTTDETVTLQHFITAAATGDVGVINDLLEHVDVNDADYDGRTALHLACAEGHVEIVEILLQRGADKNLQDRWGNTPSSEALKSEHNHIKACLLGQHWLKKKFVKKQLRNTDKDFEINDS